MMGLCALSGGIDILFLERSDASNSGHGGGETIRTASNSQSHSTHGDKSPRDIQEVARTLQEHAHVVTNGIEWSLPAI